MAINETVHFRRSVRLPKASKRKPKRIYQVELFRRPTDLAEADTPPLYIEASTSVNRYALTEFFYDFRQGLEWYFSHAQWSYA